MVLVGKGVDVLGEQEMFLLHSDSVGGRVADFSCAAVPTLVPAKEDGRKLAYLLFSELYKLFPILLLFTPFSFTIINLI